MTQRMINTNHNEDWLRLAARCAEGLWPSDQPILDYGATPTSQGTARKLNMRDGSAQRFRTPDGEAEASSNFHARLKSKQ